LHYADTLKRNLIVKKRKIYALYRYGRKPIFVELAEDGVERIHLNGRSSIAVDRLEDLLNRALVVITALDDEDTVTTEDFYFPEEWESKTNSIRRLLGMGLVFLVTTGRVPLTCVNPTKPGTKKYRIREL